MHRSITRLAIAAVAALTVTACAGGDDEAESAEATTTVAESSETAEPSTAVTSATTVATTQPATTTPATDPTTLPPTTTQPTAETDTDVEIIDDFGDVPAECRNALADFLRTVEPMVSDIDWDTATMADFEQISTELEDEGEAFDAATEDCNDFDFASDEESLQAMIEFAEEEAPGTVGWLEFIGALAFSGDDTATAAAMTCEEAIAYFDELIAGGATTMSSLPVSELTGVTSALNVITTDCDVEVMDEFLSREDVTAFLG